MKHLLIEGVMTEIGEKRHFGEDRANNRTSLESLLIHIRLLQKELSKRGQCPFQKLV